LARTPWARRQKKETNAEFSSQIGLQRLFIKRWQLSIQKQNPVATNARRALPSRAVLLRHAPLPGHPAARSRARPSFQVAVRHAASQARRHVALRARPPLFFDGAQIQAVGQGC